MNFFLATLGELLIVEVCVLFIWFKVLLSSIKNRESTVSHKRLLMTSLGLVLNAIAITGVIVFRIVEYLNGSWPFVPALVAFYVMLAVGNIMFIIAAAIGHSVRVLKIFCGLTFVWTTFCIVIANFL